MVTKTTCAKALLAAAAGLTLSGSVMAQATGGREGSAGAAGGGSGGQTSGQLGGQAGERAAQSGQQGQQQGQQVDQQIMQQLQQAAQEPQTAGDKLFVIMAAVDNQCEIQLAQQAMQKTQNDEVKRLAQQIIQDHQQMGQQLQQTAQQLNVRPPQGIPSLKQQEAQVMLSMSGEDFDRQYIAHLQAGHAKDIAKFQSAQATAKNDQVKQFASASLPKLQQHGQHVDRVATAVGLPETGRAVTAGAREQGTRSGAGGAGVGGASGTGTGGASESGTGSRSGAGTGSSTGAGAGGRGTGGTGTSGGGAGTSGTSGGAGTTGGSR